MILVPFLFFTVLTTYWWRKHKGLDICVYMAGLYALISFLAVIIYFFDLMGDGGVLMENDNITLGVIPTLLFCGSIGLSLLPFSLIYGKDLKEITVAVPRIIDAFSLLLIVVSLLNLYLVADSTLDILQGDLAQIRKEHYAGQESPAQMKVDTMSFALKLLYMFNVSTIHCLPIFFYNICFRHKRWWWNGMLLFASLSAPIVGIQVADRTEIVFWGLMLLFCAIFFYRNLPSRSKWILSILSVPVLSAAFIYFLAVSQARFDGNDKSSSSAERAIQYAGQGYLNFCYFYENANTDYISAEREFPFIYHFALHKDSNADRREERSGEQGFFISVFPTFAGDILLDTGVMGLIVWVIIYFMLAMLLLRRAHRTEMDLSEVLLIYLLAIIPIFGIFYYRLFTFQNSVTILATIIIYVCSKNKIVFK